MVDGTLTLKAGSVVIVPYGVEDLTAQYPKGATFLHENYKVYDTQFADDKFFVWVEIQNDIPCACGNPGARLVFVGRDGSCYDSNSSIVISGPTPSKETANTRWYDTSENLLKEYTGSEWVLPESYLSFPFALATADDNKIFTSIDQVFNGMGYIGSTVWVDKGVKGLIPNGRNEDGSLRNIEYETSTIATQTLGVETTGSFSLNIGPDGIVTGTSCFEAGQFYSTNGVITSFQPKQPFRAVDTSSLTECVVIIDSYVNGASGYNIYSNGYCEQWGGYGTAYTSYTTKTITFLKKFKDTNYYLVHSNAGNGNAYEGVTYTKTTNNFSVVNSANYNSLASWKAGGYLAKGEY